MLYVADTRLDTDMYHYIWYNPVLGHGQGLHYWRADLLFNALENVKTGLWREVPLAEAAAILARFRKPYDAIHL